MFDQKLLQQAIESAKCRIYRLKANQGESLAHQMKAKNQIELQKITVAALERQVAKKPMPKGTHKGIDNFYCPNCIHPLTLRHEQCELPYCDICGQKLDWSNEDEE